MYRPPYYDSPPIDLLVYPDGFETAKVVDLDAEYEEEEEAVTSATAADVADSTEVKTDDKTTTTKKKKKKGMKKGMKRLYVIETDTQQRDMNAPTGLYGLYLSSYGPDPLVNRVAEQLMSTFSEKNEGKDSEYDECDRDGCYTGFACFNYGGTALSINVNKIESDQTNILRYLYQKQGLLQKVLHLFQKEDKEDVGNNKSTTTETNLKQDDVIKRVQEFIDRK